MIGVVGDRNEAVPAHVAIDAVLDELELDHEWLATDRMPPDDELASLDGVWCAPASPYADTEGALRAIRVARTRGIPFLGTCGGFQHALIEYARDVAVLEDADHAESNPGAATLVVTPLVCSLVEADGPIEPVPGTMFATLYGDAPGRERYHCSYGLAPDHRDLLDERGLRLAAVDDEGEVRAVELSGHPFFVATLFQPERSCPPGRPHPVVAGFGAAVASYTSRHDSDRRLWGDRRLQEL